MNTLFRRHCWGLGGPPFCGPINLDLIFNDPPYNIGVKYADDPYGDDRSDYPRWVANTILEQARYLRPGGTFWWMCPEAHADFVGPLLTDIVGPRLYRIVWYETFAQYQQKSLTADYRFIFCHRKGKDGVSTFNPDAIRIESERQRMGDKRANPIGRVPGQVWQVRRLQGTSTDRVDWHPAQLPPELLTRIVAGWTNPGDAVMDGFAGSGNMGKVCRSLGRSFIGVDQSRTYIARMREEAA